MEIEQQKKAWNDNKNQIRNYGEQVEKASGFTEELTEKLSKENKVVRDGVQDFIDSGLAFEEFAQKKEKAFENKGTDIRPQSLKDQAKSFASSALSGILNGAINASVGMIASSVVEAGLTALNNYIHRNEIAIEEGNEARDAIDVQTKAFNNQKKTLNELSGEYARLSKGVRITGNSIKNLSLNDEEFQSFIDTSNQIASIAPGLAKGVDSEGNFILEAGTNVASLNKSIEDYITLQRDVTHIDTKENLNKQYDGLLAYDKEAKKTAESLKMQKANKEQTKSGLKELTDILDKKTGRIEISTSEAAEFEKALSEMGLEIGDTADSKVVKMNSGTVISAYGFNFDGVSEKEIEKIKTLTEAKVNAADSNVLLADSEIKAQKILQKAKWKELIPSIQSYVNSSNVFDELDATTAEQMRKGINTMVSNIDYSNISDDIKDGDITKWIDEQLIVPVVNSEGKVREAWKGIFDLEDMRSDDEITIGEWAKQRNEYLKTIAEATGEDWTSIAAKLGYGNKDENGKFVWGMKNEIERATNKAFGTNHTETQFNELRGWLDSLTNKDYEIAIDMILDSEQTFTSIEQVKKAFNSAKFEAEEVEKSNSLSLDAMQQQVTDARAMATALSTGVNEALSKGGVSTDTINLISSQFDTLKDEFSEVFPDGDLGFIEANLGQLFANTSDGVKLNIDALEQLSKVRADIRDDKFYQSIEANKKAIENAINSDELEELKGFRKGILQEQSQWMALKKQQEEFFSDYSAWGRAQSTPNEGDKYVNMVSGLQAAKNAYDHGLVGTDDFKTFAALISPTSSDDALNFAENYNKAQRYLTQDRTGVDNFLSDLKAKDLAEYNEEMKRWTFNIDDMDKAAQDLGINTEFLAANFGRLRDYGIDNNVIASTEDGISRIKELTSGLAKEQKRLEWLEETQPGNTGAIEGSQNKIDTYKANIRETLSNIGTVTESTTTEISANYDAAVLGVKAYDEAIAQVEQNTSISEGKRSAMVAQLQAEQELLAESVNTTVDALRNEESIDTSQIFNNPEKQETYLNTIDAINSALEDQNSKVSSLIDTIGNYSFEELNSINFGDGKYDDSIGEAEKAVDSLTTALGLTKEQTDIVIAALKAMNKLNGGDDDDKRTKEVNLGSGASYYNSNPKVDNAVTLRQQIADAEVALDNLYRKQDAGIPVDTSEIEAAKRTLADLLAQKEKLGTPTVIEIDAQIESAQSRIQDLQAQISAASQGGFNPGHEHIIANAQSEIGMLQGKITGLQALKLEVETSSVKSASEEVNALDEQKIAPKDVDVNVNAFGAISMLNSVQAAVNNIPSSKTVTVTTNHINRTINMTESQSKYGPHTGYTPTFAGTMLSPARASGTAYNVLNLKPMSSYASGTVALEEDEAALVNELEQESIIRDGVWSLIPGKMHVENLKKGDIILNGKQTQDLLTHGKTGSFAKAYNQGTTNVTTSGTSPLDKNTDAIKDSTKETEKNTESQNEVSESLRKTIDELGRYKNWIENRIDLIERKIEKYTTRADNSISGAARKNNLNKASDAIQREIDFQNKAKDEYEKHANKVAKEVGLSDELKKKVQNGKINIELLTADQKAQVDAYSEWYSKILDCLKNIRDLEQQKKDIASEKVQNVVDSYDIIIDKRKGRQDYWAAQQDLRKNSYQNMDKGTVYYSQMKKELYYANEQARLKKEEASEYKKAREKYYEDRVKELTPKLGKEKAKKYVQNDKEYQKMLITERQLMTEFIELTNATIDLKDAMFEAEAVSKKWRVDVWNRAEDKHDAVLSYKESTNVKEHQVSEKDYLEGIKIDEKQIQKKHAERELLVQKWKEVTANGSRWNEKSQELEDAIAKLDTEIMNDASQIQAKIDQIMEIRLKPYYDAQEALAGVINEYQSLQKMLGDMESFFNDDGSFTTAGLANIALIQESIDATKQSVANATAQLDILEEHFQNGNLSPEEYKQKSDEAMEVIRQGSEALAGYKQQMLDMYETQLKMENDLLQKNIDKRLEALNAKEA